MSQYHQGPHFPVSSSPILPLDAPPSRSRCPSSLTLDSRLSLPTDLHGNIDNHGAPALPRSYQYRELSPSGSVRSAPADWVGEATPIDLEASEYRTQHRRDSQPSTGTSSPYTPAHLLPNAPIGWIATPGPSPLNLVPYKPFPESLAGNGTSFFYRSPTPSARQRINQACEKCRDRKTKCSGGRPTCVRCQARGLICEYATQHRVRGPSSKSRKRSIPPLDGPGAAPATRKTAGPRAYVPRMSIDHLVWESRAVAIKAPEGVRTDLRTSWTMSDHSDESNESGGAAAYAQRSRGPYLGLNGRQGAGFVAEMPLDGFNAMHHSYYRAQTAQHAGFSARDKDSAPLLRVSASMPQLKPGTIRHEGENELERSSSSIYSTASLNASFAEFFSSSDESLQSRCPSSSSSPASNSHSSPEDQDILPTGISSNTIRLESWPENTLHENEKTHSLDESEDPVYRKEETSVGDVDGDTPRPSSQPFNASDWIHGDDYSQPSSDYQFPTPPTPES